MKIDLQQVEHVAQLARLRLRPEDAPGMTDQLNRILGYMDKLAELDTSGIEPMAHAIPLETPYRRDETGASLEPDEALSNAPERRGGFFVVPRIL